MESGQIRLTAPFKMFNDARLFTTSQMRTTGIAMENLLDPFWPQNTKVSLKIFLVGFAVHKAWLKGFNI